MKYHWKPNQGTFRLPYPTIQIKEIDGKKGFVWGDVVRSWDEEDALVNNQETEFFENQFHRGTKKQREILKPVLEFLYADRKEIKRRTAHHRSQADKSVLGWR